MRRVLPAVLAAMLAGACGKMGPPLAPIVSTPARIMDITPRRLGDTVLVRVAIPDSNLDGSRPVDLDRVDVYAFTGLTQTDIRDLKYATKVGTIKVQRYVSPAEEEAWKKKGVPPPPNPGVAPGGFGTVTEVLTPEALIPVTPREDRKKPKPPPPVLLKPFERPLAGPVPEVRPRRYYAAVGISRKNVKGPNSVRPSLSLEAPPSPPLEAAVAFTATAVTVSWKPPAEQREPIQEPVVADVPAVPPPLDPNAEVLAKAMKRAWAPVEQPTPAQVTVAFTGKPSTALTPPLDAHAGFLAAAVTHVWARTVGHLRPLPDAVPRFILPATPKGIATALVYTYNVYLVGAEPPPAVATPGAAPGSAPVSPVSPTLPLNATPLTTKTFDDPIVAIGAERCYVVRAVDDGVESEPTPPVCVTPIDSFPPPAPTALAAIGSEGAVSLIWEGVEAADLAGYIVMRGEGPDAPLVPLFDTPIRDTAFRDATAKSGVRYTYAVVSVDTAVPRNVSLPSNRVDETAR